MLGVAPVLPVTELTLVFTTSGSEHEGSGDREQAAGERGSGPLTTSQQATWAVTSQRTTWEYVCRAGSVHRGLIGCSPSHQHHHEGPDQMIGPLVVTVLSATCP